MAVTYIFASCELGWDRKYAIITRKSLRSIETVSSEGSSVPWQRRERIRYQMKWHPSFEVSPQTGRFVASSDGNLNLDKAPYYDCSILATAPTLEEMRQKIVKMRLELQVGPGKSKEDDKQAGPSCCKCPEIEEHVKTLNDAMAALREDLRKDMEKMSADLLKEMADLLTIRSQQGADFSFVPLAGSSRLHRLELNEAAHESGPAFTQKFPNTKEETCKPPADVRSQTNGNGQRESYFASMSKRLLSRPLKAEILNIYEREEELMMQVDSGQPFPLYEEDKSQLLIHVGLDFWIQEKDWVDVQNSPGEGLFIRRLCRCLVGKDAMKYTAAGKATPQKMAFPSQVMAVIKYHLRMRLIKRLAVDGQPVVPQSMSTEHFAQTFKEASAAMDDWCNTIKGVPCKNFSRGRLGAVLNSLSCAMAERDKREKEAKKNAK